MTGSANENPSHNTWLWNGLVLPSLTWLFTMIIKAIVISPHHVEAKEALLALCHLRFTSRALM